MPYIKLFGKLEEFFLLCVCSFGGPLILDIDRFVEDYVEQLNSRAPAAAGPTSKAHFTTFFQTSFEFQISFASLCPSLFPLPSTLTFVFVVLFRCVFDDLSISSSRCQDKHWWSQSIGGVWNWKIGSLPAQSQPSHYLWWLLWWLWHCSLATLPWLSMLVAPSCWWFVCSPDVCWCLDTTQRISPQNFPSTHGCCQRNKINLNSKISFELEWFLSGSFCSMTLEWWRPLEQLSSWGLACLPQRFFSKQHGVPQISLVFFQVDYCLHLAHGNLAGIAAHMQFIRLPYR